MLPTNAQMIAALELAIQCIDAIVKINQAIGRLMPQQLVADWLGRVGATSEDVEVERLAARAHAETVTSSHSQALFMLQNLADGYRSLPGDERAWTPDRAQRPGGP